MSFLNKTFVGFAGFVAKQRNNQTFNNMNRITDKLIKILSLGIGLAIGIVLIAKG